MPGFPRISLLYIPVHCICRILTNLIRPSVAWAHYFRDGSPGEDGARGAGTDGCLVVGASSG